jgi:type III secretion protein J
VRRAPLLACLLALAGCAEEEIFHHLDEAQANQVLVALGEAGLTGRAARGQGDDGALAVLVPSGDAAEARRVLAGRDLPRARAPGFSDLFGSPGLVPTPVEERARYLHALSGELSRSLETVAGVTGARVHLALPAPDPLRPEASRAPRASVLLRCRPDDRATLESQVEGLRRLVAGAADGLDPSAVSVVVAEAPPSPQPPRGGRGSRPLLAAAAGTLVAAAALGLVAWRRRTGAP